MFALTFGQQEIPPMAQKVSKKQQRLNYNQYRCRIKRSGDMALMSLTLDKTIPTVADFLASPLAKYITLAANDCGYSGKAEELIFTYVHPLFLTGIRLWAQICAHLNFELRDCLITFSIFVLSQRLIARNVPELFSFICGVSHLNEACHIDDVSRGHQGFVLR